MSPPGQRWLEFPGRSVIFIEWLCCFDKWPTGINRCNGWRTLNSSAEWGHSSVCPMFHTPIYLRFLQNPRLQDCQSSCNCHTSSIVLFLLQHPDYNTSCLDISFKDKDKAMSMNLQTISELWLHPYSPFSGYFMLFCVWKKDGWDLFHSYLPNSSKLWILLLSYQQKLLQGPVIFK